MATVFIPPLMRPLANGLHRVEVEGTTLRQVIDSLERNYPGMKERLCEGDELKPGIAVGVDGIMGTLGLRQKVQPQSEIHFLPAIGGG